jgi:hypothetical protein
MLKALQITKNISITKSNTFYIPQIAQCSMFHHDRETVKLCLDFLKLFPEIMLRILGIYV